MLNDFATVYDQFRGPLKSFIAKRIRDENLAEDLLHDVFLKIHSRIDSLEEPDKLAAWIYQIARNSIIDSYRKKSPIIDQSISDLDLEQDSPDKTPDDLNRVVQSIIEKLPEADKEILLMADFQGLKQSEIAEQLGITLSGAKSRIQRARKKLKELLLECCHFEFDRYGTVFDYHPKNCTKCCGTEQCR